METTTRSYNSMPQYLEARTAKLLLDKMNKLNRKDGGVYNFFSIYSANGKHYAWFYREISKTLNEEINDGLLNT